jgi:hypothetical protein
MTHEVIRLLEQEVRKSADIANNAVHNRDYNTSHYYYGCTYGLKQAIAIVSDYLDSKGAP